MVKVKVFGRPLTVRAKTPDLRTAISNLGGEFSLLTNYLSPECDGVIVDAGGYIGTAAIRFSEMFPMATIVTLEPEESNLRICKLNTKDYPSIRVVNCALVGIEKDWVTIHDSNCGEWGFTTLETSPKGLAFKSVGQSKAQTIQQLNLPNIALVKMDIEGAEKEIFESNSPDLGKVPIIVAELHDRLVPGCSDAFENFSKNRTTFFDGTEKWYSVRSDGITSTHRSMANPGTEEPSLDPENAVFPGWAP
jgi:FkbM family methyltransferase